MIRSTNGCWVFHFNTPLPANKKHSFAQEGILEGSSFGMHELKALYEKQQIFHLMLSSLSTPQKSLKTCATPRCIKLLLTRNKKLLGAKGIATRSKKLLGAPGIATRNKKLLGADEQKGRLRFRWHSDAFR